LLLKTEQCDRRTLLTTPSVASVRSPDLTHRTNCLFIRDDINEVEHIQ